MLDDQTGLIEASTVMVGSIGEVPAFGLAMTIFTGLPWMAWKWYRPGHDHLSPQLDAP